MGEDKNTIWCVMRQDPKTGAWLRASVHLTEAEAMAAGNDSARIVEWLAFDPDSSVWRRFLAGLECVYAVESVMRLP